MSKQELLRRAAQPTRDRLLALAEQLSEPFDALLRLLAACFCEKNCSITEMRREVDATDWHMKLLRRTIGLSICPLLRACRLETAVRLLRDTSLKVEKIAELVGYKSKRSLELLTEELTGFSPGELRILVRTVPDDLWELFDELFSCFFRVRHHRGELDIERLRDALAYLEGRLGPF